jgi:hypothetical protein
MRYDPVSYGGRFMSEIHLSGSCLCGSVAYEIHGDPMLFAHCHCQRCRKATGTGHATNIILKSVSVDWTAGENLLRSYKVPEAKRFTTVFCSECGSTMPRVAPDNSMAVIPAGTLDMDPGIRPEMRVFQDSRTDWSCPADDVPAFDQFPSPG